MPATKSELRLSTIPKRFGVLLGLWLLAQPVWAASISGRVVGVSDGDTVTVLDSARQQHRIRLAQIDAPEKRQDFGQRSKQSLSDLVYGKTVTVEVHDTDRYGRTVGQIIVAGLDANLEQIRRGMAWVYRQYAKDPAYFTAEEAARQSRVGLWSQPNPTPPWEFRHGSHHEKTSAPRSSGREDISGRKGCGKKKYCKQMTSCEEARFYLQQCGLSSLDRDGDGTPCESLCNRAH